MSTLEVVPSSPAPPAYTSEPSGPEQNSDEIVQHKSPTPPADEPVKPKFPYSPASYIDDGGLPEVVMPQADDKISAVEPQPATNSPVGDDATVTPLHLLGDQPDTVDCPFCRRRTETRVKKKPSTMTHVTAVTLFCTTVGGAIAPYKYHWKCDIHHYCTNCDRKVAWRRYNEDKMQPLGTPEHLKVASVYPAATNKA